MTVQFDDLHLHSGEGIADKTAFSRVMCEALPLVNPGRLLDLGCGSGIIGLYALLNGSDFVYFNDIQEEAIQLTQSNLHKHAIPESSYQLINMPFQDINIDESQLDAIFFNPPQLPTDIAPIAHYQESQERIFRDGGSDGLNLINQYVTWLAGHLPIEKPRGYLGISSVLLVENVIKNAEQQGLHVEKKYVKTVPLREIFYPAVENMPESERNMREISPNNNQWDKKIYILEFRKSA